MNVVTILCIELRNSSATSRSGMKKSRTTADASAVANTPTINNDSSSYLILMEVPPKKVNCRLSRRLHLVKLVKSSSLRLGLATQPSPQGFALGFSAFNFAPCGLSFKEQNVCSPFESQIFPDEFTTPNAHYSNSARIEFHPSLHPNWLFLYTWFISNSPLSWVNTLKIASRNKRHKYQPKILGPKPRNIC